MSIDGATRYYLLDVPANTDNDTPLALVFGLHGFDMNNVAVIDLFNFTSRSNGQAITVLPQGEGPPPGDVSHWGDGVLESRWMANETNYTFIQTLLTELQDRYCVDPSRLFIAGFSMGGFFTNSLACAHPDWFRGFAPVAGGGPGSCANAAAKPAIMITHGTQDDIVTPDSGEASRDFWVEQNGCSQTTTASFTGCQSYAGCPDASPVIYCVGNWNHTISATASANIWSFFNGLD
jgi:poly(3-hydroxybutyrate) depolymerase